MPIASVEHRDHPARLRCRPGHDLVVIRCAAEYNGRSPRAVHRPTARGRGAASRSDPPPPVPRDGRRLDRPYPPERDERIMRATAAIWSALALASMATPAATAAAAGGPGTPGPRQGRPDHPHRQHPGRADAVLRPLGDPAPQPVPRAGAGRPRPRLVGRRADPAAPLAATSTTTATPSTTRTPTSSSPPSASTSRSTGPRGWTSSASDLEAFIDETTTTAYNGEAPPTLVLLSPIAHEDLGTRGPCPTARRTTRTSPSTPRRWPRSRPVEGRPVRRPLPPDEGAVSRPTTSPGLQRRPPDRRRLREVRPDPRRGPLRPPARPRLDRGRPGGAARGGPGEEQAALL